ncbi:MAG: transketolase [Elusimicrobia bacterium]|nr:transketolase [Elusimicrobiota bacterium]
MKLAFVETLIRLARANRRIMLLTGDLGFQIFDRFQALYGPRYVNVGVAEAQLVGAAAGLAMTGYRPVTYSIASFATARCFEQIKLSIAYHGLPVVLVGGGGGYAYGECGVTHHSGEDLSLLSGLPGMTVVAPGDAHEVERLLPQVLELPGPAYFRIGRGQEPRYHSRAPVLLGKARLIQEGGEIAVLSTGEIAGELVRALRLLKERRLTPLAYQFHTVKPLDVETLRKVSARVRVILVLEEHLAHGGLGSQVAAWLAQRGSRSVVRMLCIPDEFVLGSPEKHQLRERYGLDAAALAKTIEAEWRASPSARRRG